MKYAEILNFPAIFIYLYTSRSSVAFWTEKRNGAKRGIVWDIFGLSRDLSHFYLSFHI
jgi:hypothetical protein